MRANEYRLMEECVERGVSAGWRRAHKHTDTPSPESIMREIEAAVMLEVADSFTFPEDGGGGDDTDSRKGGGGVR
jgi:hypothetical protein